MIRATISIAGAMLVTASLTMAATSAAVFPTPSAAPIVRPPPPPPPSANPSLPMPLHPQISTMVRPQPGRTSATGFAARKKVSASILDTLDSACGVGNWIASWVEDENGGMVPGSFDYDCVDNS